MKSAAKILIAEDDPSIRTTLADVLIEEGYSVFTAQNGSEAMGMLRRMDRPVLVLLDLNMPVMDGVTLLSRLRDWPDRAQIEVVVMSGAVDPEWFRGAPGVIKAFRKPFDVRDFLSLAEEFVARHASTGASVATLAEQPTTFPAAASPPPGAGEEDQGP